MATHGNRSGSGMPITLWGVLILLGICSQVSQAKPTLWGNFYLDGCPSLPSNMTKTIDLQQLTNISDQFFLQLEIYGTYEPELRAYKSCTLPSSDLYIAKFKVQGSTAQMKYVLYSDGRNSTSESKENGKKKKGTCLFLATEPMKVFSGYGFLSCRNETDVDNVMASVKDWKERVKREEAASHTKKMTLLGAIIGGMALLVTACIICVILRLRATRDRPARQQIRQGTPARSAQVRVTHDPTSETQHSMLSSGRRPSLASTGRRPSVASQ